MTPLYRDPHFTFRFADDGLVPRFHLDGVAAGRRVTVYRLDPRTGGRLDPPAEAVVGDGGWVDLQEPLVVRAGEGFVAVPELRLCLLHELAHVFAGPREGHGRRWRELAKRIGARPERCNRTAVLPQGKWRATCHGCQRVAHRHRRPKRVNGWFCRACGPRDGRLVWYKAAEGEA